MSPPPVNVSLRQLKVIISIARLGSFGRAAKELGLSQSALSQAVQQFESLVGVKLLDRSTRNVRLSKIGEECLPGIQRAVDNLERELSHLQDLRHHKRGHVSVACLPSIALRFMPRMLRGFRELYPNTDVTLKELSLERIRHAIMTGQADIAIANISADDPDLNASLLTVDRFALVMRREHPLAASSTVTWREAAKTALIAMSSDTGVRAEMSHRLPDYRVEIMAPYEAEHPATILALVEADLGAAPLPGLAWPAPDHPHLTYRPLIEPVVERKLYLIKRPERELSPAAHALFTHIQAYRYDGMDP
ncbi:LysR family transcriptional regulator [Pararobbsia silviterrae]|uniref:LysR family transcriptional regulator n=1 Tax=Pararobbsia silviterrae TaxID=1792498 RepID=A0A494YAT7_9BURK|nr:LysR family transcriptional regulator [Pararobbsia silviterrae]RKP57755.1 LysR family transcriptional regulator [Pararobbsia silviterrae]